MIIRVQAKARNRVRDHAAQSERIVVRALEEMLIRMRISNERRSILRQRWAKIRTLEAGQPQRAGGDFWIGPSEHFKLQIRDELRERNWWIIDEVPRAGAATLFTTETDKVDRAAWFFTGGKRARQLHHGDTA